MEKYINKHNGITLIALIITVVILVIIAGVAIFAIGSNGIFGKTRQGVEEYRRIDKEQGNEVANLVTDVSEYYYDLVIPSLPPTTTTGEWIKSKRVNSPKLADDMTAIYFDESGNIVELTNESDWNLWYDYSNKKWANAKTADGNYWVWIPRFAYKITSNYQTGFAAGNQGNSYIDIKFVDINNSDGINTYNVAVNGVDSSKDYYVHPAFVNDSSNNYINGGWDSDLPGIWVAKFEVNMLDNGVHRNTNVLGSGESAISNTLKISIEPNFKSWRWTTIGNCYSNSLNYNSTLGSHLIKNSEWGAIAYLTHSIYGLNGNELANNTSGYYTGGGAEWMTDYVLQSTTGNMSGIYDLNGGASEFVSGYLAGGNYSSGLSMVNGASTRGASQYVAGETITNAQLNFVANDKRGDAIREITGDDSSWYASNKTFLTDTASFFVRNNLFGYSASSGAGAADVSFRITLAF